SFGAVAAILQPISGDFSAKDVAERQPAKLAALEGLYQTSQPADLIIGGIPNDKEERVDYAIHIPGALSYLAHGDFDAEVIGLDQFAKENRPPVLITHVAFQIMVAIGMLLALAGLLFLLFSWRWKHLLSHKRWLLFIGLLTPLGFLAVEAGWTVTEVGRQPWIIYNVMRTKDAVSPMPGLQYSLYTIVAVYLLLTFLLVWLMQRQIATVQKFYPSARNPND
ncbi:MAG: cytochrome ubiquinol oxidase subunit I, partial [Bacteroidetes bacterium]|nr:cytochrome ubiquinol oxidase subunit I [Bacteroidota bacterium]